jgi:hypothetical protein
MTEDWRVWRPAIWIAMLGAAIAIAFSLPIGVAVIGGAIGVALRTRQRLRRAAAAAAAEDQKKPRRRR